MRREPASLRRFAALVATLALLWLAAASPILAATPIARLDLPWWRARFTAKAAELQRNRVELVFYGDSITQNFERVGSPEWADFRPVWKRFYGDRHAVNLGFKGDTTASLLWRLRHGEADGIAPKAAIMLIGANNLGRLHWPAEATIAGIAADVAELRHRLPHTSILLLGILPSGRGEWAEETRRAVNAALAARYAGDAWVRFVDAGAVFMKNGVLDRGLFYDPLLDPPEPPLHPTAAGMARLAAAIEPVLSGLLGDRPH